MTIDVDVPGWDPMDDPWNLAKFKSEDRESTALVKEIGLAAGGTGYRVVIYHSDDPHSPDGDHVAERMVEDIDDVPSAILDLATEIGVELPDPRDDYEVYERAVCDQVPIDLRHVPDRFDRRFDAALRQDVDIDGRVATAGTDVEIKTCRRRNVINEPGRFLFGRAQYDRLVRVDGVVVMAAMTDLDVARWQIRWASSMDLRWYATPGTPNREQQASPTWREAMTDPREIDR